MAVGFAMGFDENMARVALSTMNNWELPPVSKIAALKQTKKLELLYYYCIITEITVEEFKKYPVQ